MKSSSRCCCPSHHKKLLFATNVDWYFDLHWRERICSPLTEGFEVTVTCAETKPLVTTGIDHWAPLPMNRSSVDIFSNLRSFIVAARILNRNDFDLIHAVTVKPNIFFGILARIYALPILMTVPGLGSIFSAHSVTNKLLRKNIVRFYRLAGRNSKSFFAFENRQDQDFFLSKGICGPANSAVVAGAGINLDRFRCSGRVHQEAEDRLDLLFAARLLKGKGLTRLVQAVSALKARGGNVALHVAGIPDSESRESLPLERVRAWHDQGKINYLGQVDDMPGLLNRVHVVVLPTTYGEGLPRILLEANACCRPVIATDIPGCNEFVHHSKNGLLVRPGNTDDLVSAIEKMFEPARRRQMGQVGRKTVKESYSMEKVITQYRQIYENLTGKVQELSL